MKIVSIKKGKEKSLYRKHPWIFSGAIYSNTEELEAGDWVDVKSYTDEFICCGHFSPGSIAVRILSFEPVSDKQSFYNQKIDKALEYRKNINISGQSDTNMYRVIFGEGDGIPGLIADYYNKNLVLQCHSAGIYNDIELIANAFDRSELDLQSIYVKSERKESYFIKGDSSSAICVENGINFKIDWTTGQKTGFFIDQRENRKYLGELSKDKSVLNVFSYSGGFSIYALMNGAKKVISVDLSESAIELCDENVKLNESSEKHQSVVADAFEYLKSEEIDQDIVILDPPAFSKRRRSSHNAVQGYKRLNAMAMKKMKKGSLLLTFSCSQNVSKQLFMDTIRSAAIEARKEIKIIHQLSQPSDHPISAFHPEGEYLKGLVLYIE